MRVASDSLRDHQEWVFTAAGSGYRAAMRIGNMEIKPLGGGAGCLTMILLSILLSVLLTVVLNLLL